MHLSVSATRAGYLVESELGVLQPGCTTFAASGVTVPMRLGMHDTQTLSRCLQTVRSQQQWRDVLQAQQRIPVRMEQTLPYRTLIATMDATRETAPGRRDLYSDPIFGLLARR